MFTNWLRRVQIKNRQFKVLFENKFWKLQCKKGRQPIKREKLKVLSIEYLTVF
jgi:hypothetical protein